MIYQFPQRKSINKILYKLFPKYINKNFISYQKKKNVPNVNKIR